VRAGSRLAGQRRCAAVALLALGPALLSCAAESGWNLLLVTLDTTRADRIGAYGYAAAATPHLDALAREGVRYVRCYSPVPLTLPSHASLLTGLWPPRHGVHANGTQLLAEEASTLAEQLLARGYQTAAVVGAFVLDRRFGLAQGFEHYDDDLSGAEAPGRFAYAERDARRVTDAALRWLDGRRRGPFLLWVHYFDPHAPYSPPGDDPALAVHLPYDAEIAFVDGELGRLLRALEIEGAARTLIVVTADHGEGLYEHGEATHGLFAYESTLRVPLLVRFPDRRQAGSVIERPVSLVDVLPSVLDWLGEPVPEELDGERLPLAREIPGELPRALYFENEGPAQLFGWSPQWGIVLGEHKFIQAPRPEFYDLASDPGELRDLYSKSDEAALRMAERFTDTVEQIHARPRLRESAHPLRDDERARLEALGYLAGGAPVDPEGWRDPRGDDPKDRIAVYQRVHRATSEIDAGRMALGAHALGEIISGEDPRNRRALSILIELARDAQARELAIRALRKAEPTGDHGLDHAVQGSLGLALLEEGLPAEAVAPLERALALDPASEVVRGALESARRGAEEGAP
jgi:arylsulfatase A-like enzyme